MYWTISGIRINGTGLTTVNSDGSFTQKINLDYWFV